MAEQRVVERRRELKPLVDEYQDLEQVAHRLGLDVSEEATAPDRQPPGSPESTQRRRRRSKTKTRWARSTREQGRSEATAEASATGTPTAGVDGPPNAGDKRRPSSNRGSRRQQDVLRLVNQHPGITVREIATELGVDATGLYRPVHKLEQQGAISKQGAALQPTDR
jgi:MarR family